MIMISDFYNDGYSIIMFTNSTAHVQRKETGIHGMLFVRYYMLHSNLKMHDNCPAMHSGL